MPDVRISIIPDGPAKVECGLIEIVLPDGRIVTKENKVSLCRCGETKNAPFCDGTHNICGFNK